MADVGEHEVPGNAEAWQRTVDHGHAIEAHRHPFGQLVYPASGLLLTTTDRGTWATPVDQIAWTPPGATHAHRTYGATDIRIIEVPRARWADLPTGPAIFLATPLAREAVLALTGDRESSDAARARLRDVIVDELHVVPEQRLYLPEPCDDRLCAVTRRLHDEPGTNATLAQLGRAVGASERTLSRLFRAELEMSFQRWRTLLRLQRALILLAEGETVGDTAVRLGWANPTSFTEAFRTVVGQTPARHVRATRAAR